MKNMTLANSDLMDAGKQPLVNLTDYLTIIRKRKWTILTIFTLVVITMTLRVFLVQPIYEGVTKIVIETENPKVLSIQEVYSSGSSQIDYYQTQYKILASRSLARSVFEKLQLSKDVELQALKDPITAFQDWITIDPVRNSRIVQIRIKHPDPNQAALIANTVAQVYIEQNLQRKLDAARYAVDWLTQQMVSMRQTVEQSELNLQKYIDENQIVRIPKIEEGGIKESLIQELELEKAKLETELSNLLKRYKEKHPKVIRVNSSLATVTARIEQEIQSVLELGRKSAQFNILKREVESNRQLYDTILSRAKETNLFEGLRVNNISIVDPAETPVQPIYPRKRLSLMLASLLGLFLGCGLAFLLDTLDNTVGGVEDVQNLTGLAVLGCIPDGNFLKKKLKPEEIDLACYIDSKSGFAESYRFVKTGIFFSSVDKPAKVILVTSSCPQEGKTTDAINLAITLASGGEKVLLIDADLRNPRVHRAFNINGNEGLSFLFTGQIQAHDAIRATQVPNLFVLPCGQTPPNPADLLESQKMNDFLTWARTQYSKIIIDSPPVMAVADPIILSSVVDGVIFIIRSGATHRKQILQALNKMSETRAKILGIVLNRVRAAADNYYYPYYYRYYGESSSKKVKSAVS